VIPIYDLMEKAKLRNDKKVSGYQILGGRRDEQVEH